MDNPFFVSNELYEIVMENCDKSNSYIDENAIISLIILDLKH